MRPHSRWTVRAAKNDWLLEFIAGILGLAVSRPAMVETTALGAAGLAGLHAGVWSVPDDFAAAFPAGRSFAPALDPEEREALIAGWDRAVRGTLAVLEGERG